MAGGPGIRESTARDLPAIGALLAEALPGEDLLPLVRALVAEEGVLSLVAVLPEVADDVDDAVPGGVVGHVIFTPCRLAGAAGRPVLLGPLAVAGGWRRRGIGRALVEAGCAAFAGAGAGPVLVLGDPGYYGRLGFAAERAIMPPHPLVPEWRDAWQSRPAGDGDGAGGDGPAPAGLLSVPAPWQPAALWQP